MLEDEFTAMVVIIQQFFRKLDMSTNQPWGYYYGWDISHDGNQLEFNLVEQLAGYPVPSGFEVTVQLLQFIINGII